MVFDQELLSVGHLGDVEVGDEIKLGRHVSRWPYLSCPRC